MGTQVHGYLSDSERRNFENYAGQHGLHVTALARVLLVRELRLRRLSRLVVKYPSPLRSPAKKVTAHLTNTCLAAAFVDECGQAGVSLSEAAAVIFRAELAEKWLEKAILLDSG
jgi:hypothetical protein